MGLYRSSGQREEKGGKEGISDIVCFDRRTTLWSVRLVYIVPRHFDFAHLVSADLFSIPLSRHNRSHNFFFALTSSHRCNHFNLAVI